MARLQGVLLRCFHCSPLRYGHLVAGTLASPPYPQVVDVHAKAQTLREAIATATLCVRGDAAAAACTFWPSDPADEACLTTTASVAGVAAAKGTSSLIPMCHNLGLEHASIRVGRPQRCGTSGWTVTVESTARTLARTGVEMEALVGASVAALTLYDMLKAKLPPTALSLENVKLISKVGGKSSPS